MNNQPVAWIDKNTGKPRMEGFIQTDHDIPLYTHPVKELTDEEIYACFHQYFVLGEPKPTHYELEYEDLIEFARAILRKASEK